MPDPRAVLTRPARSPDLTVEYGTLPEHVADVWLPSSSTPAPLVIVIHGGFWRAEFDRSHTGPQCEGLAAAGFVVASIEYRRVGAGGGWPTTFDDVALALDTVPALVREAAPGRVDTGGVIHIGHSAGGQLAVWSASRHRLPQTSPWWRSGPDASLRGVVSLAGVLDLREASTAGLGDGATTALLGGGPDDVPDRYAVTDPMSLRPADVPVILIHGTDDDRVPLELSRRYAAGQDNAEFHSLPAIEHFGVIDPESAAWPAVVGAVSHLLRALDDS
jgi:acetyl esterase/lipase